VNINIVEKTCGVSDVLVGGGWAKNLVSWLVEVHFPVRRLVYRYTARRPSNWTWAMFWLKTNTYSI